MLIICNGVVKGGSTWIVSIVRHLDRFDRVPEQYQNSKWGNSSIDPSFFPSFLDQDFFRRGDFYAKQHISGKKHFRRLLADDDIRVINIVRDLRDMIVSCFFHHKRMGRIAEDLSLDQYFESGVADAWLSRMIAHHAFWHAGDGTNKPFLMSYERLHDDFSASIRELIEFLDHPELASGAGLAERLHYATNFEKYPHTGSGQFLRKGAVGDHRNHLSAKMEQHVRDLAFSLSYHKVKSQMSKDFPELERYLSATDVGVASS